MALLWQSVPDAEVLLSMEPEELGYVLLGHIASLEQNQIHPSGFNGDLHPRYPANTVSRIEAALMEAWAWLQSEALLVPTHGNSNGWSRLSRRGIKLADPKAFAEYRAARLLPRELLHPLIRDRVWLNVMREDYDLAVFEAMRAVEIAVRDASAIDELGVKLMRSAFHQDTGPLRDPNADGGEREARMHLFAGAIGSYKNPVSHRHVPLDEAAEVIEQIMLANHLLRIVDSRERS